VFAPLPPDPVRPFEWWWLHQYWIELDAESRLLRSFGVTAYDEVDALELLRDEFVRAELEFPPVRGVRLDHDHRWRKKHRGIWFPEIGPIRQPGFPSSG
jgi:hypothetical protein